MTPNEFEALSILVSQVADNVASLAKTNAAEHKGIHERLDGVSERQDKINGGIAVLRWLIPLLLAGCAILAQSLVKG